MEKLRNLESLIEQEERRQSGRDENLGELKRAVIATKWQIRKAFTDQPKKVRVRVKEPVRQ